MYKRSKGFFGIKGIWLIGTIMLSSAPQLHIKIYLTSATISCRGNFIRLTSTMAFRFT
jgi:hypothetical protein